ncbi:hypothetical protein [Azohydromonas australica]|uniref:hypothetical protein n=1 Tax=Azohydromonas australica TaxID=364039 RepID=UPI0005B9A5D9|nr:hypothetical protein [Azohydromonas australica]
MDRQRGNREFPLQGQALEPRAAGRRFLGRCVLVWLAIGAAVSLCPEPLGTAIPMGFLLLVPGVALAIGLRRQARPGAMPVVGVACLAGSTLIKVLVAEGVV